MRITICVLYISHIIYSKRAAAQNRETRMNVPIKYGIILWKFVHCSTMSEIPVLASQGVNCRLRVGVKLALEILSYVQNARNGYLQRCHRRSSFLKKAPRFFRSDTFVGYFKWKRLLSKNVSSSNILFVQRGEGDDGFRALQGCMHMIGSSSKERGKKEATKNGDGYAAYVSQTARDKQNAGEGEEDGARGPVHFRGVRPDRRRQWEWEWGNNWTRTEHKAVHAQPPGRAHLVCVSYRPGEKEREKPAKPSHGTARSGLAIASRRRYRITRSNVPPVETTSLIVRSVICSAGHAWSCSDCALNVVESRPFIARRAALSPTREQGTMISVFSLRTRYAFVSSISFDSWLRRVATFATNWKAVNSISAESRPADCGVTDSSQRINVSFQLVSF